jgi:hypothetical protein
MIWTGRFEKFLEVIIWLLRLVPEITLDVRDMLLIRVVHFLVVVIVVAAGGTAFATFCYLWRFS